VKDAQMNDPYLFEKMRAHWGHDIEIGLYGEPDDPANMAVECVTCYEVIVDEDAPQRDTAGTQRDTGGIGTEWQT
jgi:hypothetical protein